MDLESASNTSVELVTLFGKCTCKSDVAMITALTVPYTRTQIYIVDSIFLCTLNPIQKEAIQDFVLSFLHPRSWSCIHNPLLHFKCQQHCEVHMKLPYMESEHASIKDTIHTGSVLHSLRQRWSYAGRKWLAQGAL